VKMVKNCSAQRREPAPLSTLTLGVECGGSDFSSGFPATRRSANAADRLLDAGGTVILSETPEIIGAEHILARRAVSKAVGEQLLQTVRDIEALAKATGFEDIRASNPSADNKKGGLTTLAEKSLGAYPEGRHQTTAGRSGLCRETAGHTRVLFHDDPCTGLRIPDGLAAGGAQLVVFNTGLGNPIANPVTPTIKVTGNPFTYAKSADDFDVSVTDIISKECRSKLRGNGSTKR